MDQSLRPKHALIGRRQSVRTISTRVVAAAAAIAAGLLLPLAVASPAQAATHAVGFTWNGDRTSWLGSYNPNNGPGEQVYCLQISAGPPTNRQDTYQVGYQTWGGDPDTNARVNYVISNYGQTGDPVNSAATALYVWSQLDSATFNSRGLDYYATRANGSKAAVEAQYNAISSDAAGITAGQTTPQGSLDFAVDAQNNFTGTLTANGLPAGSTGVVTLTNGTFDSTGTNSAGGVQAGQPLAVTGVPPAGSKTYKISATGTFTSGSSYAGDVMVYNTPGRQATAGQGERASFTLTGQDPNDRSSVFLPVLSTQVSSTYVPTGQTFGDTLTFSTAPDAGGTNNPWHQNGLGNYSTVIAKGTLYGPFASQPAQAATVPTGAPVAGTATASTGTTGPTQPITASSAVTSAAAGYYTWVWSISYADQPAITQNYIPDGYSYVDDFGRVAESSVTGPAVTSQAQPTSTAGFAVTDTATVTGDVFTGAQIGFSVYKQPVGGAPVPTVVANARSAGPSANAQASAPECDASTLVATTTTHPVAAAGDYTSDPVTFTSGGTYYWVATVYDASGTPVTSGVCGDPSEVTLTTQLVVTTQASSARVNMPVFDTATLTGTVPVGATLSFQAFQDGRDNSGALLPAGTCGPSNLIFDTSATPSPLTPGVFTQAAIVGPSTTFATAGTVDWVETVRDAQGTVITSGVCGEATESSIITPAPPITTLARTGSDADPVAWGIGAAAAVACAAALVLGSALRRRRIANVGNTGQ